MSKGMLGMLPLSDVQGVINDIQAKLATNEGPLYLAELKKFARKKPCWIPHLIRPTDFNPAKFVGLGFGWEWGEMDADPNALALSEVDFSRVFFETCLNEGELSITGKEKLRRLKSADNIRLDPRFGVALFQEKGQKMLERLFKEQRGITYIDFFGRILLDQYKFRHIFFLHRLDCKWHWGVRRLDGDWWGRNSSASLPS